MCVCVWVFKGVRGGGEVQGGPVVVTSDLSARSRASQKPLQMHPALRPPCHRGRASGEGESQLSSLSQRRMYAQNKRSICFCEAVNRTCTHPHACLRTRSRETSHTANCCRSLPFIAQSSPFISPLANSFNFGKKSSHATMQHGAAEPAQKHAIVIVHCGYFNHVATHDSWE